VCTGEFTRGPDWMIPDPMIEKPMEFNSIFEKVLSEMNMNSDKMFM
jgi:hypothetical protein